MALWTCNDSKWHSVSSSFWRCRRFKLSSMILIIMKLASSVSSSVSFDLGWYCYWWYFIGSGCLRRRRQLWFWTSNILRILQYSRRGWFRLDFESRTYILIEYRVRSLTLFWISLTIESFFFRPLVDHTTGTSKGFYIYIESSYPQNHGDKAWLVSEVLDSPQGGCLEFWYHMKGQTTGNMTVYQRVLDKKPIPQWFMKVIDYDHDINIDLILFGYFLF